MNLKVTLDPNMAETKWTVSLENERGEKIHIMDGSAANALKKKSALEKFLKPTQTPDPVI